MVNLEILLLLVIFILAFLLFVPILFPATRLAITVWENRKAMKPEKVKKLSLAIFFSVFFSFGVIAAIVFFVFSILQPRII